ncbi:MAG: FAD-binding oxidoreductase [Actinomycetota bacterium]
MSGPSDLAELLGPEAVVTRDQDLEAYARDWSASALLAARLKRRAQLPLCVARPRSEAQVSDLLRWAHDTRTPVVPFGGGSSVVRGIEPSGAVVVDLRSLDEVEEVDETSLLVTVGAGAMGPDLGSALGERGFRLGHEPQSVMLSTVGGWLATRACGQLSARFGGIENLVAGLRAVLPGGRVVVARPVPRSSVGPDLKHLLIGSEGALAIITEATLRIEEIPAGRASVALRFDHMSDGVSASRRLAQSELHPTIVRLYDGDDSMLLTRHLDSPPQGCVLLLSFEGARAADRCDESVSLCRGESLGEELVEHWWTHRNDAVDEYRNLMAGKGLLGPHALIDTMEVAGTWSGLRGLYHSMKEELRSVAHLAGCHLSHVYSDGACLYFTLASACADDDDALATYERWWSTGMAACLAAGGSISHHHGIGRLRARWLPEALDGFWEVLTAVKKSVDPHGIMNPGVLGL